MGRRTKAEVLREKLEVETLKFKVRKLQDINSKWDAVETNRSRRQPKVERKPEGEIYNQTRRMKGCSVGRDLERNYSPAKSMLHQFRVNVVGSQGKVRINAENAKDHTDWFNQVWSKDCDFREDCDWSTMLQNVMCSEIREGDALVVFDDGVIENSGKLITWEADQICAISDDVLKAKGYDGYTQDNGIIRDKWGRVVAYCATGERGANVIDDPDKVTVFTRDDARLVKMPWRLNQGRGTPALLTPAANMVDLYEMLASELQTAKREAMQYAYVSRKDAVTDWDDPTSGPEFLPENMGRTSGEVDQDGANQTTQTAKNYEAVESLTGGMTDYIDPEDEVTIPDLKHPNRELSPFIEAVLGFGGSSLGMARAYTIMRADSSYTSFRGDMIMTWVTFRWWQKHLERALCDWVAQKAISWGMSYQGLPMLADGWQQSISWNWPIMPEVDQLDYENAVAQSLKNGTTDYSELLGPDWRVRLESLAEQIEEIRRLGLPLSVLEMKSGGSANDKKGDE
jgi:capsid protein